MTVTIINGEEARMMAYDRDKPASLATDSALKKWWLTTFRGYEVCAHLRIPRCEFLGRIWYTHSWQLTLSNPED